MPDLPLAAMHRLAKKAGAERVSLSAMKELSKRLEEVGVRLAGDAYDYAMHAGRKTVKATDIELAAKRILRE